MMAKKGFDENELKEILKVTVIGYGEKRDRRINISIEPTIRKKAEKKCRDMGVSLSECINQLLYIWSKDVVLNSDDPVSDEEQTVLPLSNND